MAAVNSESREVMVAGARYPLELLVRLLEPARFRVI